MVASFQSAMLPTRAAMLGMRIITQVVIAVALAAGPACSGSEGHATGAEEQASSGAPPAPREATGSATVEATGSVAAEEGVPEPGPEHLNRQVYQEVQAQSDSSVDFVSLCPLVRMPWFDGMGLYVVDSLTLYREELFDKPGEWGTHLYVELTLLDPWYMAEKHPVARIAGSGGPDGVAASFVDLKIGEPVGLFLTDPKPYNRGYNDLHVLGTFNQREDGGYTNGQLFTQRVVDDHELGRLVKGLAGGDPYDACPYDEAPDLGTNTPPTPTDPNETPPTDVPQPGVPDGDM